MVADALLRGKERTTRDAEPTVFVVDDDAAVLRDLEGLLGSVRLRTQIYLSVEDFFGSYNHSCPSCLILEDCLPGLGGIGAYRRLRQDGDGIPVIFLTDHGTVGAAVRAMREGAFDFLETPPERQYLIERVQAAIAQDLANWRQEVQQKEIARRFQRLSPRESAIAGRVAAGQTSKAIAQSLGITVKTVNVHRGNIMRKVGAATSADLARLVFMMGGSHERPFGSPKSRPPVTV